MNLFVVCAATLCAGLAIKCLTFLQLSLLLLVIATFWKKIYISLRVLPRDARFIYRFLCGIVHILYMQRKGLTVGQVFSRRAAKHPNDVCFYFEDKKWTNKMVEDLSNKIANIFQNAGFRKGQVVALLMENRPEYVCIWLGLSKIGVVTALVNTNLRHLSLIHSIKVAESDALLYSVEYAQAVKDIASYLNPKLVLYQFEGSPETNDMNNNTKYLDQLLPGASSHPPKCKDKLLFTDKLVYIYTSGTTGLPKAAVFLNSRFVMTSYGTYYMSAMKKDDIIYNALPLYHSAGGILGIGISFLCGVPNAIRRKFSASNFWTDCIKYNCTVAFYIGEMCRYIVSVPPKPEDTKHKVRLLFGSGLKARIWEQMVSRFKIPNIVELYGSTEGNANALNFDNTIGAVGFIPTWLPSILLPINLIKIDEITEQPIRDKNGLCVLCKPGETGMIVGKIVKGRALNEFSGYVDKTATKKKVIQNVFAKGDYAFVSGDLLMKDELGYLYFKDRIGDSFRWKGENVSTTEVQNVITSAVGMRDSIVYGVEIPGMEGKAGMAAIVDPNGTLDLDHLSKEMAKNLPSYAQPFFLRIAKASHLTGTFKLKKFEFQKEGFDPSLIMDKLYFKDKGGLYVPLTNELYNSIVSGETRL